MSTMTLEHYLLASYLDDGGWHCEAENVRQGVDLESYEIELRLIDWLNRHTNLAQPAQAVDVWAIREVIENHKREASLLPHDPESREYLIEQARKLTRALGTTPTDGEG